MKKKLWLLVLHLVLVCGIAMGALLFAEELVALKQEIYYFFNPLPVAGETNEQYTLRQVEVKGDEWFADRPLIYHAGGQIQGNTYTNSLEAVENTLSQGKNVIELDLRYTSDGHLVCAHAWYDAYIEDYCPTLEEFQASKIQGKYTPLTADMVVSLMRENPQMYLVTDVKEEDTLLSVISGLVDIAEKDSTVLDRLIIQLYTGREKGDVQAIYPFRDSQFLFTTYKWGKWQHEVAAICNEENISVITVPYGEMSDEDAAYMRQLGFTVYEFTVNRADYAQRSLDRGISSFYTDALSAEDLSFG